MRILISLSGALGLLLAFSGFTAGPARRVVRSGLLQHLDRLGAEAGYPGAGSTRIVAVCGLSALGGFAAAATLSPLSVLHVVGLVAGGAVPLRLLRIRREKRREALRFAWPDVMAHLISGVRAGLSLAECCSALSTRGPEELRPAFGALAATYAATGRFDAALTRLQDSLEDPVADRVVAVLRMAHAVGGNDLVRLLRTSAELIREDLRIRGEIRARWSWTITAARLAAAAPFLVLLMMGTRPEAATAYATGTGTATIIFGCAVSLVGYRLMLRAARLPEEPRIR